MSDAPSRTNWSVERRLEFIEFRLYWEGGVRRNDIRSAFGVSEPQASKDLSLYQERAPGNATYDKISKKYVAGSDFSPRFLRDDPAEYLLRMRSAGEGLDEPAETWLGSPPDIDVVLNPAREVDAECLRSLLRATREGKSLEVRYQSMSRDRPAPTWRRITPHAFGYDGFRWHVRALCHETGRYKDFLVPRITGTRDLDAPGPGAEGDGMWNQRFDVLIAPHPELAPGQRQIVEKDYAMRDGTKALTVRYAMLFYLLRRLNLLGRPEEQPPRTQHIVVLNREETDQALAQADWLT